MELDTVIKILYVVIPIISAIGGYFIRDILNRIFDLDKKVDDLDAKTDAFLTHDQIRLLIADKTDPLMKSMDDIKKSVDRVMDLMINFMNSK